MGIKFHQISRENDIETYESTLTFDQLEEHRYGFSLFHYTSAEGLKSIITNKELWLTKSEFLNDRYEIKYTLELVMNIIEEFMSEEPVIEEQVFKEIIKQSIERKDFLFDTYVLSMSKNGDSNLLWSNYSSNDGYNIEFEFPYLASVLNETFEKTYPDSDSKMQPYFIVYEKEKQREYLSREIVSLYKIFLSAFEKGEDDIYYKFRAIPLTNIFMYSIFFKANCFLQEEEFRIAAVVSTGETKIYECRLSNGVFIPYLRLPITSNEFRLPIKSITIGPKNNLDIARDGLEHFIKLMDLEEVEINKSEIPYRY